MKKTYLVLLAFSLLTLLISCGKGRPPYAFSGGQEGLTLSSRGEATSPPDQIKVTFSLGALQATSGEALVALEEKHVGVISALESAGIDTQDLKMTGYNLVTERRWDEPSRVQVISGFRVNKDFALNLDFSEEMIGKVFATLASVPSDARTFFYFDVKFGLKNPQELAQTALASAIFQATEEAEFIAKTAGVRLGSITMINPDQGTAQPIAMARAMNAPMSDSVNLMAGAAPTNVEDIKVSRQVSLTWSLLRR